MKIASILLLISMPILGSAQDTISGVGITRSGPPIVKLAIPDLRFSTASERTDKLAKVFNDTLWADLDFSGNIELVAKSFYPLGTFALPGDIRVEDWTNPPVGAYYIAYGALSLSGGRFAATGRLRDLKGQQDSIASNFPGFNDQDESARLAAHNFADRILEQLGFGRGISRTQISFVSDRGGAKEIYVMDYDGTNQHALTANGSISITPSWSRGDERIAYTVWRPGPQIAITSTTGERFSFSQSTGAANYTPSWSPDGKSIVYSSRRDGNYEIYLADADGRNPKRLTNSPGIDASPVFNPATGRRIAFVSDRSGSQQIYTMSSDGTDVQRITEDGGDAENPAYSPDGSMIAFAWQKSGRTSGFDIFLYVVATQKFIQLTDSPGNDERPTWAPDGKHIAFQSNRNGSTQIYSITIDGKKLLQLTNSRGINEGPTWSGYTTP